MSRAELVFGDRAYSSAHLASAVDEMVTDLKRSGVHPSARVVVRTDLTDHYVIVLLALLRLRCCVVPLDTTVAKAFVERVVRATQAVAVVEGPARVIATDRGPMAADGARPTPNRMPPDAAYVLFTSGTTGAPKGVVGTYRGLQNRVEWGQKCFYSDDVRRCAIKTSPGFIDSLTEIVCAYAAGKALYVAPLTAQRDLGLLSEFIEAQGIEQITLTPSVVPVLAAVGPARLAGVRRWILSGEPLRPSWARQLFDICPNSQIINSYGSTEVCGDVLFHMVDPVDVHRESIPLGRPASGVLVEVRAAAGVSGSSGSGELWVGGDQVSVGYLSLDGVDQDGPFECADDGTRWFATGDVVTSPGGVLCLERRVDDLVKVRGRRVSPTATAQVLEQLSGVRQAHAWIGRGVDGEMLNAVVELGPGCRATPAEILEEARQCTLSHLIPDRLEVTDNLTRTSSGKVDRRRVEARSRDDIPRTRFSTGIEYVVAGTLHEATGDPDIHPDTEFSDLGLNSMGAVIIADRLSRMLGSPVTGLDVLSARTVSELARRAPGLARWDEGQPVRIVEHSDRHRALLLIHPAVGTCLGYFNLVRRIGYGGVIAFAEQNRVAREVLDRDGMDGLAGYYARSAAEVLPGVPIDVAGYSFGALLASSVARQLTELGHEVPAIALIDALEPANSPNIAGDWAIRRILDDAGYGGGLPAGLLSMGDVECILRRADGPLSSTPLSVIAHWTACLESNVRRSKGYRPSGFGGPTLIVRSDGAVRSGDSNRFPNEMFPKQRVVDVAGTHFELLHGSPLIVLAENMSRFFEDVGV